MDADNGRFVGLGSFGKSKGTDQEVCPTYIIQYWKKRLGGLRIVFIGIQLVTRFCREPSPNARLAVEKV